MPAPVYTDVSVANAGTTSQAIDIGELVPVGLITPSALTSVSATFQVSLDGSTYATLRLDDGSAYTVTVAASYHQQLDYQHFLGFKYLKVVLGSAEAAARTLKLLLRPM